MRPWIQAVSQPSIHSHQSSNRGRERSAMTAVPRQSWPQQNIKPAFLEAHLRDSTEQHSIPNLAHSGRVIKQDADKAAVFSSILETTFNGTTTYKLICVDAVI